MTLTIAEKELAIQLHIKGFKISSIVDKLNRSRRTIFDVINKWKKGIFPIPKLRKKRKRKLSAQQVQYCQHQCCENTVFESSHTFKIVN